MLCATIKTLTNEAIERANRYADLMEWRLDLCGSIVNLTAFKKMVQIPLIITLNQAPRSYDWLRELNPDYLDLPHTISDQELKEASKYFRVILSYHNFEETPHEIVAIHDQLAKRGSFLVKIATTAQSTHDTLRVLDCVKKKGCIGIAMGKKGEPSRILGPFCGSPWTYAPVTEDQLTASGQLMIKDLLSIYRVQECETNPAFYGLVGEPLTESQGERIHNFIYSMLSVNALYVKLPMGKEEFLNSIDLIKSLGFKGLSVTMPLKECAAELVEETFGINTLTLNNGVWSGRNTDVEAADHLLSPYLREKKEIVILGAGATGAALGYYFSEKGHNVRIYNRSKERESRFPFESLSDFVPHSAISVVINTIPAEVSFSLSQLGKECVILDLCSRQNPSELIKNAKKLGLHTIDGETFYYKQAEAQCTHWFLEKQSGKSPHQVFVGG